ncbi:MAG: FAD-binding protein, partial [Desulfobacterota bacterium]|nr:FAD-binding protein [Thermodesulfobacteriota bacterium]
MDKDLQGTGDLIRFVNSPQEVSWDVETDVLIIGGGGCGLIAALAAAEKGAHVFLVEKEKAA